MDARLYARIKKLSEQLQKMAEYFSKGNYQTADDLYQSMIVALIERQAADASFVEQNDSYILDAARKSVCLPTMRRARLESKRTVEEPSMADSDETYFDTVAGPGINPEQAYLKLEQALVLAGAIRDMSDREREVLTLTVKGVPTKTIAADFGISPAAVSIYKSRAVSKLQAAVYFNQI
jgi:RNA polymerase sigma factor (sigma-70 family)